MASDETLATLQTADATYNRIRSNQNLSGDAKRTAIAAAYLKASAAVQQERTDSESATTNRIQTLSRQLFGLPATATSADMSNLRDAQARVSDLDRTSDAIALINQSHLIGDTSMERAILGAAFANQWTDVIDAYLTLNPKDNAAANELWDLNQTIAGQNNFASYLQWIVPMPPELRGYSQWKIEELATGATSTIQVLS